MDKSYLLSTDVAGTIRLVLHVQAYNLVVETR